MEIILIVTVFFVGGLVQGAAGFGIGLVSMALLGLLMPVREAAVINVLAALCINFFMLWRLRRHLSFERILPLVPSILLGVPLGVGLLVHAPEEVLNGILAAILIIAGSQAFLGSGSESEPRRWHPLYAGIPCGLFSGGLAGAYGTGGPPLVAYVLSQGFGRRRYAASVQILLAIGGSIRFAEMTRRGLIFEPGIPLLLATAVGAVGGAFLGLCILHRLPDQIFRRIVALFLLFLAVRYIWLIF